MFSGSPGGCRRGGSVGRDILVWANTLRAGGVIGRDVEGQTLGRTTLSGRVGRDFQMTVAELRVTGDGEVGQDLIYQAGSPAQIADEATVGGTTTRRAASVPNVRLAAVRFVSVVLGLLAFVWIGMLMIWLMPETMREATNAVAARPVRSFMVGIVAFLLPVLLAASIITLAALSPPDLALTILGIGAPVWLSLLVVLLLGIVLAPVPVAIAVGRRLLGRRRSAFAAYLLGIVIYVAILFIPVVGLPIAGVVGFVGLGALARGAVSARGSLRWATGEVADERTVGRRSSRRSAGSDRDGDDTDNTDGFFPRLAAVGADELAVAEAPGDQTVEMRPIADTDDDTDGEAPGGRPPDEQPHEESAGEPEGELDDDPT